VLKRNEPEHSYMSVWVDEKDLDGIQPPEVVNLEEEQEDGIDLFTKILLVLFLIP
jgi:hypothetical protein